MLTRFCRNRAAVVGLIIVCVFAAMALAAPLASTYDPEQTRLEQKLLGPSPVHLLGTDHLGRDILARLAYGARFSLVICFAAVSVGLIIGVPLGAISGFYGGWLDLVIQRLVDVQGTLGLGATLLTAAGLGFLGLGVQQPTPEWGSMLGEGRSYIFSNPNLATFPGIAIFLTVLGFNLAGDGLRDALDPLSASPSPSPSGRGFIQG